MSLMIDPLIDPHCVRCRTVNNSIKFAQGDLAGAARHGTRLDPTSPAYSRVIANIEVFKKTIVDRRRELADHLAETHADLV